MAVPWAHGHFGQAFPDRRSGSQSPQPRDALEQGLCRQSIRRWPLALSDCTEELGNLAVLNQVEIHFIVTLQSSPTPISTKCSKLGIAHRYAISSVSLLYPKTFPLKENPPARECIYLWRQKRIPKGEHMQPECVALLQIMVGGFLLG